MQFSLFARVIVDVPIAQPLDYTVGMLPSQSIVPGLAVVVPVGRTEKVGIVVECAAHSQVEPAKLRSLLGALDAIAPLPDSWLQLTRFAAEYYHCTWGEVALPALPLLLRRVPGPRFAAQVAALRRVNLCGGPRQADVSISPLPSGEMGGREGNDPARGGSPLPLAAEGQGEGNEPRRLRAEQAAAVAAIGRAQGFVPFLLFGATGSGKTEVYLEAIRAALALDPQAQALMLVPEINLTPQLEALVRARFPGESLASLHSGLADGERNAAWLAAHEGRARILIGTRLAVFASMPRLRLLVVDEEHDPSFKSGKGVRSSARDLALKRAQLAQIPVVLGSATPALETWAAAQSGRYTLLTMTGRGADPAPLAGPRVESQAPSAGPVALLPRVETVDLREHPALHGLTGPLRAALVATLARGEQALVYINRRGYAPVISCDACGWLTHCPRCSAYASFHKLDAALRCHHCGWQAAVPAACPVCGNQDLHAVGQGTQRIEESLREVLPVARIARIDRDSTRRKHAAREALDAMHAGAIDVLVGTQMIAKGHDFRRVTLVGVLNADAQLLASDFRAPERLFATLLQVAGRAGRGGQPGRVLLQTRFPGHPLYAALAAHDFARFAGDQLAERRAARLPPYVYAALLTATARTMDSALGLLQLARELGLEGPADLAGAGLRLFDAVPMALERVAGEYRAQLLVEADRRADLHSFITPWLAALRTALATQRIRARWHLEVDPVAI